MSRGAAEEGCIKKDESFIHGCCAAAVAVCLWCCQCFSKFLVLIKSLDTFFLVG